MFEGYPEDWPGIYSQEPKPAPEAKKLEIIDTLKYREKWTPDFKKIRLYKNILVFVHDQMIHLGAQHKYMEGASYLGKAVSVHDSYTLKGHRFPVLLEECSPKSDRAKIKGEMYCITPERLLVLDKVKFNGNMMHRQLRSFFLKDQKYETKNGIRSPSVKAWVYIGKKDCWEGDHLPTYPSYSYAGMKDKKYYEYFPMSSYPPAPSSIWDYEKVG